jgi:hypothetical protein
VAYELDLPPSLAGVHDIFHMSQLKILKVPVDIVLPEVTPLELDFTYPKHPIKILDEKDVSQGARWSSSSKINRAIMLRKNHSWLLIQLGWVRTICSFDLKPNNSIMTSVIWLA